MDTLSAQIVQARPDQMLMNASSEFFGNVSSAVASAADATAGAVPGMISMQLRIIFGLGALILFMQARIFMGESKLPGGIKKLPRLPGT